MRKEYAKYTRYCLYCGKKFKAKRPGAKFCSDSHRAAYSQERRVKDVDEAKAELYNKIESLLDIFRAYADDEKIASMEESLKTFLTDILDELTGVEKKKDDDDSHNEASD